MNLSEPFIRKPVMTAVLTISVIVFGVLAYTRLPVNDLPVVDYPVISVQANYPGASPDTVANNIATPLERQFMQINGLELVTSQSTQGHVSITLQFALDKSIDAAATDVQTAISQATGSLPTDLPSPPTFSKTNPNDQPILYIALTSDTVTAGRLYDYGSTQVGQRISILPGVSSVNVFGTKSAVRIKVEPSKMWARGISIDDLVTAVKNGTSYTGAGQFDSPSGTALLRPNGQLESAESYGNLIVSSTNGAPVFLHDIAHVEDTVQDERIKMRFWVRGYDEPSATVVVAVNRQAGSNAVEVSKSVRDLLPIISAELPGSVRVTPIYDRSQTIVNSVADVQTTLLFAFVLVVGVIFIFLGRATDTLIPAVALPLSLLLTFMAMRVLGYSLDNLSLMALTLAIGFLVDDAIVFLENTVRLMEKGLAPLEATLESAKEISFTILSMTISLAAVFFPLVFMSGLVGRIFREFAITIVVSIIASGLVSLTLTPLMCARLLKPRGHGVKQNFVERTVGRIEKKVLNVYGKSLWWFLGHRWISALTWVACMVGTVLLFMAVPKAFLPVGDSSFVWGVMIGKRRLLAGSNARTAESGGHRHALGSRRGRYFHADGQQPISGVESGIAAGISESAASARSDRPGGGRNDGQTQLHSWDFCFPAAHARLEHQHGSDEPESGTIRVRNFGSELAASVRRRAKNDGQDARISRVCHRFLGLFQSHAESGNQYPAGSGAHLRRFGNAHFEFIAQRVFAKLFVSDQEAGRPVPGDSGSEGFRTRAGQRPVAAVHPLG